MEPLATLKHHRKSDNMYRFGFGAQTITVTRRFLPSRAVRVRVTSETVSGKGEGNWTEFRDYTDMHEGDAAYSKQATRFTAQWEERYVTPAKKENPAVNDTTPEQPEPTATQWAGGATLTPAKAAALATRRTGVRHTVTEDGAILMDTDPQPSTVEYLVPADATATLNRRGSRTLVEETTAGRVLGTYVFRVKSDRPTRTGEMGKLLTGTANVVTEARIVAHAHSRTALTGHAPTDDARQQYVSDLQAHTSYFTALLDAGYCETTRWDDLVGMLRPLLALARQILPDGVIRELPASEDPEQTRQAMVAAALFLQATEGVRRFFEDDEDDEAQEGVCPDCHATLDEAEEGKDAGEQTCPNRCHGV